MNIDQLKAAQRMRQDALDYVNAHPGASGPDIIRALEWDRNSGSGRLMAMVTNGELARQPMVIQTMTKSGHLHQYCSYAYTALVKVTKPAEAVMEEIRESGRTLGHSPKTRKNSPVIGKWTDRGYINTADDREPIKNQEAIGSGRSRVFVGSTYNMI